MNWELDRSAPVLASSYFWTWDHSTNWVLDDPGILNFGCTNKYMKQAETFVEDYRRLTDLASGLGVKGIVIWGFLRDSHGGIDAAKQVCDYASSKGVVIMPGLGTNWYGGAYYDGDHQYSMRNFLSTYPEAAMVIESHAGMEDELGACPLHPAYLDWLREGIDWLFSEFNIGGMNIENGDFVVCRCPRCETHRETWPENDPDFFRMQALAYLPALEQLADQMNDKLITWATYTSFSFGLPLRHPDPDWPYLGEAIPSVVQQAPQASLAQWTLTGVVHEPGLPLAAYLDNGAPEEVFDNKYWPADLMPPVKRSTGFLHQASQWCPGYTTDRYRQMISTIKEGCLRASRAGLEGLSIHGEVTSRHIPWALNYLAFSHFIHQPEDSLRAFGRKTLGAVLKSEADGELFVEALCSIEERTLGNDLKQALASRRKTLTQNVNRGAFEDIEPLHFWQWLDRMALGAVETDTASFF
ncbi:hypothetical protein ACFL4W_01215 [Planctomycetota bacterium]